MRDSQSSQKFSLRSFIVHRPDVCILLETKFALSEAADVSDPLANALVDMLFNDVNQSCIFLEERQGGVKEGLAASESTPRVHIDHDFMVALAFPAMLQTLSMQ